MIKNFETITYELTDLELEILPALITGLKTKTKGNPIKAPKICEGMQLYLKNNNYKLKFTQARLRKMINYIRCESLLPVIATSKGYYVSYSEQELDAQIESLVNRANGIMDAARGLKQIKTI